jgi:hypothetical protein
LLSVPVSPSEDVVTHFCWQPAASPGSNTNLTAPTKPASGPHCEDFVPSGEPIVIPAEIMRLEIQTSGRHTLTVEWTSAHAMIVPKNFSAQVEFALPAPRPDAAPVEFTLRYTIGEPGK